MYALGSREHWPENGLLNYYIILQLELFCQRKGKWEEVPYIQAFMKVHNEEGREPGTRLLVQRQVEKEFKIEQRKVTRQVREERKHQQQAPSNVMVTQGIIDEEDND